MKKQFFRVKQLADQTFSRADKTEVLSDDLQEADRRVECIRIACQNTTKKLAACVSGQGQERDKRVKKAPEHMLGVAMQECASGISDEEFLLGKILHMCGKIQQELATDEVDFELDVEQKVIGVLQAILEKDVPNIMKHKRNLTKLTLDMDSAKTRYHTALKHSTSTGTARVESIKTELEEAETKVEQCRDQLASEMFQLVSRESVLAQTVVQYIKFQKEYHEAALSHLEMVLPQLEKDIVESSHKPVFGVSLEEHLQVTERKIALPIEMCVWALLILGMEEEGLFRVAGGASKLRRMKLSMDARCLTPQAILDYRDPHVIAGALKSYLRELPEPLMTFDLYEDWMAAARVQTSEARLQALWQVVQKLPPSSYNNLRYVIRFLHALSSNHEVNKMTPQNIAIVIAPNLIWSKAASDPNAMGMNMNAANTYSLIVDSLVSYAEWFFPGELDFYENFSRENVSLVNGMSTSVGPIMTSETLCSSPPSLQSGHTRNSSGEGQLISLGEVSTIKRTQSSSSLSDHSSPPQGSPKPATRRKNKPAPVPPSSTSVNKENLSETKTSDKPDKPPRPSVAPAVATLPRPSKKNIEHENKSSVGFDATKPHVGTIGFEHFNTGSVLRRSLDLDHNVTYPQQQKMHASGEKGSSDALANKGSEDDSTHSNVDVPTVTVVSSNIAPVTAVSGSVNKISVHTESLQQKVPLNNSNTSGGNKTVVPESPQQKSFVGITSGTSTIERRPQQRPVAAPRSIVNISSNTVNAPNKEVPEMKTGDVTISSTPVKSTVESSSKEQELSSCAGGTDITSGVQLRRTSTSDSGDRLSKPVVPERPAALRPLTSSFRVSRLSSDSDNTSGEKSNSESERPMLERTHMYSVDKQQVSIIQVGGEREKTEPGVQQSPSLGSGPQQTCVISPDKPVQNEKPQRPPKLEIMVQPEGKEQRSPSHWRTHSEGNIVDFDTNKSGVKHALCSDPPPGSPRVPGRPPRPIPPPPPPPVKPRTDSVVESTDL